MAGFFVAFGIQFMMEMLGLAIGAAAYDPGAADGIGTTAVIWLSASALISLFAGGYVAARLAGIFDEWDGVLHGITAWAVIAFVALVWVGFGISSILGGVTNLAASGLNQASNAVAQVAPQAAQALPGDLPAEVGQAIEQRDATLEAILNDAGANVQADGELAAQEVRAAVTQFLVQGPDITEQEARQEAVDALAANTNLTEAEIQQQLDEWQASYNTFVDRVQSAIATAAETTAEVTAITAGIIFAALIIGLAAAGMGGWAGAQNTVPRIAEDEVIHREAVAAGD